MKTFSTYFDTDTDLGKFVKRHKIKDNEKLLIQIFTAKTKKKDIKKLLKCVTSQFKKAHIIGATTDGEILGANVTQGNNVISFTKFKKTSLKAYITNDFTNFYQAGKKLSRALTQKNTKAIIAFIDGLSGNGEEFLEGIHAQNQNAIVAGGLAGDGAKFKKTYVFSKDKILKNGVVGVSLSSNNLIINNDYSFNWASIGKKLTITKVKQNRVYTIDDKTAYETYSYYLGKNIAKRLPAIGIEFPLIITRGNIKVARAVLKVEKDGSLVFAGNFKKGDKVHFGYGDIDSILSHTKEHTKHIAKKSVQTIFIYSCMARRRFLGNSVVSEIAPFSQIAPTSGFFTYGEFFTSDKKELMNQTMTVLALSEVKNKKTKTKIDYVKYKPKNDTTRALSHLVSISFDELQEQKEKAQIGERVKADFLANMSHEIRTPMNGILGLIELLKQTKPTPQQDDYLTKMDYSAKLLLEIINDILDFSKIEAGKLTIHKDNFNMQDILSNIEGMLKQKAKDKGINLIIKNHLEYDIFYGDTLRLNQVLLNLLGNGIKFTNDGFVSLELSHVADNKVLFKIEDSGIGISKKDQKKLFSSFSQVNNKKTKNTGGTGLGLVISKKLIELMGGNLNLKSEISKGSSFYFELDLPKGSITQQTSKHTEIDLQDREKVNVLLVEDNKINQDIFVGFLKSTNIDIDIAQNGKEAVKLVRQNKNKYSIIFMDIQMPIMDGYEATKFIRRINKNIPIVALSANVMQDDRHKSKMAGMNDFLNKPVKIDELFDMIKKYIHFHTKISSKHDDIEKFVFFKNIDAHKGFINMDRDLELYDKILLTFYEAYKNIDVFKMEEEELKRVLHTIKSTTLSIGAQKAAESAKNAEKDIKNKKLLKEFQNNIKIIIDEIKEYIDAKR